MTLVLLHSVSIISKLVLLVFKNKHINAPNKQTSLMTLKKNALKLDLKTDRLTFQKLINKKEVKPNSSHPKNTVNRLFASTNINILIIKRLIFVANSHSCA